MWWNQDNGKVFQQFLKEMRDNLIRSLPNEKEEFRLRKQQGTLELLNSLVNFQSDLEKVKMEDIA